MKSIRTILLVIIAAIYLLMISDTFLSGTTSSQEVLKASNDSGKVVTGKILWTYYLYSASGKQYIVTSEVYHDLKMGDSFIVERTNILKKAIAVQYNSDPTLKEHNIGALYTSLWLLGFTFVFFGIALFILISPKNFPIDNLFFVTLLLLAASIYPFYLYFIVQS
jgi:ABC-type multidrug transport system fused ATPase/permease subunit